MPNIRTMFSSFPVNPVYEEDPMDTGKPVRGPIMCEKCHEFKGRVMWSKRHRLYICFSCFIEP